APASSPASAQLGLGGPRGSEAEPPGSRQPAMQTSTPARIDVAMRGGGAAAPGCVMMAVEAWMNTTRWLKWTVIAGAALLLSCGTAATVSGKGGGVSPSGSTPHHTKPADFCMLADDCDWGEIDREILPPADCPCLFGCPYLPLSKTTVERRKAQYQM